MKKLKLILDTFSRNEMVVEQDTSIKMLNIFNKRPKLMYDKEAYKEAIKDMNIPERLNFETSINHKCKSCGTIFDGWNSFEYTNSKLLCICPKCSKKNTYSFWCYEDNNF